MTRNSGATAFATRPGNNNGSNLPWLVAVLDGNGEPCELELERAKARYRRIRPDWPGGSFHLVWTATPQRRALIERILAGESGQR